MNPEFTRNLWLETGPFRLFALAAAALALLVGAYLVAGPALIGVLPGLNQLVGDPTQFARVAVAGMAEGLLAVFLILWGTRSAADAVLSEIGAGTWDGQRLSMIGPWAMSWGKLLGAPAAAWIIALVILVPAYLWGAGTEAEALRRLAFILLAAIAAHAAAFAIGLSFALRRETRSRAVVAFAHLVGILVGFALFSSRDGIDGPVALGLYGHVLPPERFMLALAAIATFWLLVADYRLMRQALAVPTAPWVWIVFLAFLAALTAGLDITGLPMIVGAVMPPKGYLAALLMLLAMLVATYAAAVVLPPDALGWRRWASAMRRRPLRALARTPIFLYGLLFAAGAVVYGLVALGQPDGVSMWRLSSINGEAFPIALFCFAIRDTLLLAAAFAVPEKRGRVIGVLVFIGLSYLVLPLALGRVVPAEVLAFLVPAITLDTMAMIVPPAAEALVALILLVAIVRRTARTVRAGAERAG